MLTHRTEAADQQSQLQASQGPPLSRERGEPSRFQKAMQMLKECRCGKCNRLLARVGEFSTIQIKCSRCATLNHVKTKSLDASPVSDKTAALAATASNSL